MRGFELAALLSSRICHDLVSPVSALSNGVEMLGMEDDEAIRREALNLMEMSADQAANRLRFFRLAFGAAGGLSGTVDLTAAEQAARNMYADGKVRLIWRPEAGELPKPLVNIILTFVLLAGEALIRGGEMTVDVTSGAGLITVEVISTGTGARLKEQVARALTDDLLPADADAAAAPALFIRQVAEEIGATLTCEQHPENRIRLGAHVKR
jgi:histidine phosphotransferase ChpT